MALHCRPYDTWHEICAELPWFNHLETTIVIYLDEFSKAKAAPATALERCSDDPTCADSSVVDEVSEAICSQQPYEPGPELPDDLAPIDDAFLDRVRALASLI